MHPVRALLLAVLLSGCAAPYSNLPAAPPKSYTEAENALRRGQFERAAAGFRDYLDEGQDPTYQARALYRLAQAQYASGSYDEALRTLGELKEEFPEQRGPQIPALQGDAHYALGRPLEAILSWEQAWTRGTEADRQVLRPRIEKAMGEIDAETARRVAEVVTAPALADMVAIHEPVPRVDAAAAPLAAADDGGMRDEPRNEPVEVAAVAETDRQPDATDGTLAESTARVACLVQLTGPDKVYGWRALNGVRLAFEDVPDALVVRDTGADPEIAVRLVKRLAADPTVVAIVGPQRSNEAEAIAAVAERHGLPVLLLSQREGLDGHFVLQAAVTQRQQASAVVAHATSELGVSRFAVLYPEEGYGRSFRDVFGAEVARQNGALVGSKGYAPGERDFAAEVAAVRAWSAGKDLQAVFIPDAAPTATALAAALRAAAPNLVLLGSESWNDAPLISQAGSAVEGAVFADAFYPASRTPATQAFVSRFRSRAGASPTLFEAQAYDAGMIIRRAIERGARTRAAVLAELREVGSYEGAGRLSVAPHGLERQLILLRVHEGEIEEIGPAAGRG